jgi:pimeloyl-ACP methyl ester carboxylesterase
MRARKYLLPALFAMAILAVGSLTWAGPASAQKGSGQVYLLRGLANIFSLGMDSLAGELREKGIAAQTRNHVYWESIAEAIVADYRGKRALGPIAIVGHSFGATAATLLTARLAKEGVPVALVVAYDPSFPVSVSANVKRAVAYRAKSFPGLTAGPGFRGSLENILIEGPSGVVHMTLDKDRKLHAHTITEIKRAFRRR